MDAPDLVGVPHSGDDAVTSALSALGPLDADPADQIDGLRALSDTLARLLDAPRASARDASGASPSTSAPADRRPSR